MNTIKFQIFKVVALVSVLALLLGMTPIASLAAPMDSLGQSPARSSFSQGLYTGTSSSVDVILSLLPKYEKARIVLLKSPSYLPLYYRPNSDPKSFYENSATTSFYAPLYPDTYKVVCLFYKKNGTGIGAQYSASFTLNGNWGSNHKQVVCSSSGISVKNLLW